tara:strand:- start:1158 stop:1295 length:138 start_codon:yes stop_codon:yes gene_type:complete
LTVDERELSLRLKLQWTLGRRIVRAVVAEEERKRKFEVLREGDNL